MSTNNPVYESAVLAREQRRWVWSYQLRSTSFLTHSVMPAAVKTRIAPCLDILSTWQIRILLEFHPKCSNNDDQVHSSTSHGRYFDRKICLKHVYQQPFGEAWGPIELPATRLSVSNLLVRLGGQLNCQQRGCTWQFVAETASSRTCGFFLYRK